MIVSDSNQPIRETRFVHIAPSLLGLSRVKSLTGNAWRTVTHCSLSLYSLWATYRSAYLLYLAPDNLPQNLPRVLGGGLLLEGIIC
jgi:hypothetical protein